MVNSIFYAINTWIVDSTLNITLYLMKNMVKTTLSSYLIAVVVFLNKTLKNAFFQSRKYVTF